jgi:uncharacterized protein (TIGR00369 family)
MSTLTPRFAGWEARVRESFARQGAMAHLGATLHEVAPGRCTIAIPYRDHLSQQHGYFHAGITAAVADSAGGYAGLTILPEKSEVLTVEFKINLIAPAHGEELHATGRVVRSGRTLTICTAEAKVLRDGHWHVCAILQQTLMRVEAL